MHQIGAIALQALEGTLTVEVRPCNAVVSVSIDQQSLPMDPVPAGSSLPVAVSLITEDQQPLSLEDAQTGLTLSLIAPGANSKAAQVCPPPAPPTSLSRHAMLDGLASLPLQAAGVGASPSRQHRQAPVAGSSAVHACAGVSCHIIHVRLCYQGRQWEAGTTRTLCGAQDSRCGEVGTSSNDYTPRAGIENGASTGLPCRLC